MTIQELKARYTEDELSRFPGDKKLRWEMFAPLFQNLHEQKVIYYEKVLGIVKMEDLIITPDRFEATAIPHLCIIRKNEFDELFDDLPNGTFSSSWDWMRLLDDESINVPYANWTVWTDPDLVKEVERLCKSEKFNEALRLFFQ